jgi:hypothetical protein
MHDAVLPLALGIAMGLVLSACAGLRAFLPLLALGVAGRAGVLHLAPEMRWVSTDTALLIFGSALFFEVVADKVPVLDHAMDATGLVVRPLAGALAAVIPFLSSGPDGSLLTTLSGDAGGAAPWLAAGAGAVTGGTVTAVVHMARAGLRIASTMITGGLANPLLSIIEDGVSLTAVALALVLPLVALAVAVMTAAGLAVWLRRWRAAR